MLLSPEVIFLLLALAGLAFVVEAANPGMAVPGSIGVALVLAAGYGVTQRPVTTAGLGLVGMAVVSLVLEQFGRQRWAGGIAGSLLLMAGGLVLFRDAPVNRWLLVATSAAVGAASVAAARTSRRVRYARRPVHHPGDYTGRVVVVDRAEGRRGSVRLEGTWWTAAAERDLRPGQRVRIVGRDGLTLLVEPFEE